MAWDKTLPANATKIRNYPTVLTDNFSAVEEGDDSLLLWKINLYERNAIPSAPPTDPARIDDTFQLYGKNDSTSGEVELFGIDAVNPANVIQMTQDGCLGSYNTCIRASEINIGPGPWPVQPGLTAVGWGMTTKAGVLTAGYNIATVSKTNNTTFNYTFTTALDNANFVVICNVDNGEVTGTISGISGVAVIANKATTGFTINITNAAPASNAHNFAIFGGIN